MGCEFHYSCIVISNAAISLFVDYKVISIIHTGSAYSGSGGGAGGASAGSGGGSTRFGAGGGVGVRGSSSGSGSDSGETDICFNTRNLVTKQTYVLPLEV